MRSLHRLVVASVLCASCGGAPGATPTGPRLVPDYTEKKPATHSCGSTRPLVVDWESSDRAQLEAQARKGLVVMSYEGCGMKVLPRCGVKSNPAYAYIAVTPKKDRVDMRDAVEMYANIPVYAAKLEARLAQSGSLHTNMVIVGQLDAGRTIPRKDELEGECDGATHVVSALTVGAFEFFAGAGNEVGGGVSVLGAGAGAKSASSKELLNRDGDEAKCASASDTDTRSPSGCGALLRIEVVPLGAARPAEPVCGQGTQWNGEQCLAIKADVTCPPGQIADKVKGCIEKKPVTALVPAGATVKSGSTVGVAPVKADCSQEEECRTRCEAGDAKGCLGLGAVLRGSLKPGQPTPQGEKAAQAFQKACDGGESSACVALGELYYQGLGVPKNAAAAPALFEKACDAGDPVGCNDMGHALSDGAIARDLPRAAQFYGRACSDKASLGCFGLGVLTRDGRGVPKDPGKAKQLFQKACTGGVKVACKLAES